MAPQGVYLSGEEYADNIYLTPTKNQWIVELRHKQGLLLLDTVVQRCAPKASEHNRSPSPRTGPKHVLTTVVVMSRDP